MRAPEDCKYRLNEKCPQTNEEIAYYTQLVINGNLQIPCPKPPVEEVINVSYEFFIKKIVRVPVRSNCQVIGCKFLIAGVIRLLIEYSADVPEQNVYFAHFDVSFQGMIMGGPRQEPIPSCDCNIKRFQLYGCIEHIQVNPVTSKTLDKTIVLMLWLRRKECEDVADGNESTHKAPAMSTQIAVDETLVIPPQKPPKERVIELSVHYKIIKAEIIPTVLVRGTPPQPVRKVIIVGKALVLVKYVAEASNQRVHAAHFEMPFQALIEWPNGPISTKQIKIIVHTENSHIEQLDTRQLYLALVIKLDLYRSK